MNQPIPVIDILGGVDRSRPAHLVASNRWTYHGSMRSWNGAVKQLSLLKSLLVTAAKYHTVVSVPTNLRNLVLHVLLGSEGIYRYNPDAPSATAMTVEFDDGTTEVPATLVEETYAYCLYSDLLWITAPSFKVSYTDGARLRRYAGTIPCGTYILPYFDHLVIANCTFKNEVTPWRTMWSHLYSPDVWEHAATNEADYFDLQEWAGPNDYFSGITGMSRVGDTLFYFLPSGLIKCSYVGLPKIMQFGPMPGTEGVGNSFPRAMTQYRNLHFFYSDTLKNFFMFDGVQVMPIGDEISVWFRRYLNIWYLMQYPMSFNAFIVPRYNEVWWTFPAWGEEGGQSDGFHAIWYNWETKVWSHTGKLAYVPYSYYEGSTVRAKATSELTGPVNGLTGVARDLGIIYVGFPPAAYTNRTLPMWVCGTNLLREEVRTDNLSALVKIGNSDDDMRFETGDRHYGDILRMKDVNSIMMSATWTEGCRGVEVAVSARDKFNDAVSWTVLGEWGTADTSPWQRLSFKPQHGRIFRWRLTPKPYPGERVRGFQLFGFQEEVNIRGSLR